MIRHLLQTGQTRCYSSSGEEIPIIGSHQDGGLRNGHPWPEPRFRVSGDTVLDELTGLTWTRDANLNVFPCTWREVFDAIAELNTQDFGGFCDWRLPNRNELRSLMSYQARKPALPSLHPFEEVFLGWYWTSTTAAINPAYAWSVHMEGARMFYGRKDQEQLFWPVRGEGNGILPRTGQKRCFDSGGGEISCAQSGQDGDTLTGSGWPETRFVADSGVVLDRLTGLAWAVDGDLVSGVVSWQEALDAVEDLNRGDAGAGWRLPNINELASLVDCSQHSPALPLDHCFRGLNDGYWSSTTSFFETDWAWVLYLDKGACGVGYKTGKTFHVWPVKTATLS